MPPQTRSSLGPTGAVAKPQARPRQAAAIALALVRVVHRFKDCAARAARSREIRAKVWDTGLLQRSPSHPGSQLHLLSWYLAAQSTGDRRPWTHRPFRYALGGSSTHCRDTLRSRPTTGDPFGPARSCRPRSAHRTQPRLIPPQRAGIRRGW